MFDQNGADLEGDVADILPADAGAGVEVDAELVGVVEIGGATGWGWSSMQPRLTIQARPAGLSTTSSSAVRPEGKESVTVRRNGGRSAGARFW